MKRESKTAWAYQKLEGGMSKNAERIRIFMEKISFNDAKEIKIVVDNSGKKIETYVYYPIHIVTNEVIHL